jgi:MFS family permease
MSRTERTFYLLFGGYSLAQFFLAPVYPLFLLSRGLDLLQINLILAIYLTTIFVFEVPTGALADTAGRRLSFVLGCATRTVAFVLYSRARGFAECAVFEFIDAVGTTLVSGALEAWAVDGVQSEGEGQGRSIAGLLSRANIIGRTFLMAGAVVCGYLAERDLRYPWLAAAAIFALTGIAGAALMHETRRPRAHTARPSLPHAMRDGLGLVRRSPVLLLLSALALGSAFAAFPIYMYWQPRLQALAGEQLRVMGWIVALLALASLTGSVLVPRMVGRFARESVLFAAMVWRGVMVAVLAGAGSLSPALTGLLLQETAFGVIDPVSAAWTNEHVASAERATVISVRSAFMTLGGALGLVSVGLVARAFGLQVAMGVSATVFLLVAPGFVLLGRAARPTGERTASEPASAVTTKVSSTALG